MSRNTHPKVQAGAWLKPNQADALETAVYRCRPDSLQERDDTILTLMFDTELLREDNSVLSLPGHLQKDYPTDNSPNAARLGLASDNTRTLT
jgi:integrase/recombinase XerC/integrase/recombinase XerD